MSELEVLKEMHDRVMNGIFKMSQDYKLTIPKKGMEKSWTAEKERAEVLKNMIERYECA